MPQGEEILLERGHQRGLAEFGSSSVRIIADRHRPAAIGADFHGAMVASAPGRITPHRASPYMSNWISDMNLHICSQENQQKLLPPELPSRTRLDYVPNRLSAGASPQTQLRKLTALPQTH